MRSRIRSLLDNGRLELLLGLGFIVALWIGAWYAWVNRGRVERAPHVILISIDGLRGDAIPRIRPPFLSRLAAEGASTFRATTIRPSITLPSHASMLTGTEPSVHGVDWNNDTTGAAPRRMRVPTVLDIAENHRRQSVAFYGKHKFSSLIGLQSMERNGRARARWQEVRSMETMEEIRGYLRHNQPDLMFVHLADVDVAGHTFGWMSPEYVAAVHRVDRSVRSIVRMAEQRFGRRRVVVIVTADHGGHDRTHGTASPQDMRIPWIAWGRGVKRGARLADVRTMDTGATALWLLGIDRPPHMVGRVVREAFGR